MGLKKPNDNAAQFETEDDIETTAAEVETVTTTAVATATHPTAVATAKGVMSANVLSTMKDSFRVDFDSLPVISAAQGSFELKEGNVDLGSEIELQLISYQDSWCCSPNDDKADKELVKYGDNATTSRDGVSFAEHIADLKEQGYSTAKLTHRVVLVGELLSVAAKSGAGTDAVETLVQIDLPDSGRRAFNTYTLQASYAVAKGKATSDAASRLKLQAVKTKNANNQVYTKVQFSAA